MRGKSEERRRGRARRHARVRKKIRGSAERPRLVVYRSLRQLEGQLVDDERGATLLGVSTRARDVAARQAESEEDWSERIAASFTAGRVLAERARALGVGRVVFDRGGYRYHGRVKAFADGAREGGLEF